MNELQKTIDYIREAYENWVKGFPTADRAIIRSKVVEVLDEIEKLTKKMCQEFPKFEQVELDVNEKGEIDWESACRMMEQRTIQRERWFKEHFGNTE